MMAASTTEMSWSPVRSEQSSCVRAATFDKRHRPQAVDPFAMLDLGDTAVALIVQRLRRAARSSIPVLLHGETGTGKELFARAIHEASSRANGRFVAINCASIPEGLIESELFGYRPGAFTGANARGALGQIRHADGGTLFLDEIGDMPLALQSRLLRVLAEQEVTPIGSDTPVKTNFRLISATHRDLGERVREGTFRADLMFRLHGFAVTLPALRMREDIAVLARRLLDDEAPALDHPVELAPCACRLVENLPWPGNVRQLKQVLGAAAWLSEGRFIRRSDIELSLEGTASFLVAPADASDMTGAPGETLPEPGSDRLALLASLRRNRWNVSRTAGEFNTARTTIYRRMAKLGIVQPHLLDG